MLVCLFSLHLIKSLSTVAHSRHQGIIAGFAYEIDETRRHLLSKESKPEILLGIVLS